MTKPQCAKCKFWLHMEGYRQGECRRSTPLIYEGTGFAASLGMPNRQWPETIESDWCGEFAERNESEEL